MVRHPFSGRIKIGRTKPGESVDARVAELELGAGCELDVLRVVESDWARGVTEKQVHERAWRWRVQIRGRFREWFGADVADYLDAVLS